MNTFWKVKKGQFGYIAAQQKYTLLRTVLFFALSLGIFLMGYITTKTKVNLLTVVAVFGCLPASKSMVNTIMFFRSKGCSNKAHEKIARMERSLLVVYDLNMTTYSKNYQLSSLAVKGHNIVALCEDAKTDVPAAQAHIDECLKMGGHKGYTIKIFETLDKYLNRLEQMCQIKTQDERPAELQDARQTELQDKQMPDAPLEADTLRGREEAVLRTLLAISL